MTHDALDEVGVVADLGREEALAVPAERKLARECQEPTLVEAPRPAGAPAELCRAVGEAPRPRDLDLVVAAPQHAELPLGPDEIRWRIGLLGGGAAASPPTGLSGPSGAPAATESSSSGPIIGVPSAATGVPNMSTPAAPAGRPGDGVGGTASAAAASSVSALDARRAARARRRRGAEASRAPTVQP